MKKSTIIKLSVFSDDREISFVTKVIRGITDPDEKTYTSAGTIPSKVVAFHFRKQEKKKDFQTHCLLNFPVRVEQFLQKYHEKGN